MATTCIPMETLRICVLKTSSSHTPTTTSLSAPILSLLDYSSSRLGILMALHNLKRSSCLSVCVFAEMKTWYDFLLFFVILYLWNLLVGWRLLWVFIYPLGGGGGGDGGVCIFIYVLSPIMSQCSCYERMKLLNALVNIRRKWWIFMGLEQQFVID